MGLTYIWLKVANLANPRQSARVRCLVDSGAFYSLIPAATLRRIGIAPRTTQTFALADGSVISRRVGDAVFILNGYRGASPVIFGKRGDGALLGALSLEALGVSLDPVRRTLRPIPLRL